MSKRDVRLFLNDMLEAIDKVERYTTGMSFETFERDVSSERIKEWTQNSCAPTNSAFA